MISGPMPAASPIVMPMVALLMRSSFSLEQPARVDEHIHLAEPSRFGDDREFVRPHDACHGDPWLDFLQHEDAVVPRDGRTPPVLCRLR